VIGQPSINNANKGTPLDLLVRAIARPKPNGEGVIRINKRQVRRLKNCLRHQSRTPSLHAPLLLWRPARGLILELLPPPSRLVILPVNHIRVNLLRRANRPVPEPRGHRRQRYTTGEQVRAVRVPQRVEARTFRQLQPAEQQRQRPRIVILMWLPDAGRLPRPNFDGDGTSAGSATIRPGGSPFRLARAIFAKQSTWLRSGHPGFVLRFAWLLVYALSGENPAIFCLR